MSVRPWASSPQTDERGYRRAPGAALGSNDVGPALQRAIAAGYMPPSQAELVQLQRTAGNRAVQRLVGAALTVQRDPTPPTPGPVEKKTVTGDGPVGGAGGALPPGSKVTVAPSTTAPAHGTGEKKEEEHATEFHAELSGMATVEKVAGKHTEGKAGVGVEVGGELPKVTAAATGKEGGPQFKFLTNPELQVKIGGAIDTKGKPHLELRTELGIDIARVVTGPWTSRLAAGAEASTEEGVAGKVGAGVEKEIPKAGGVGFKAEAAAGLSDKGPSGEGTMKVLYGLKKGEHSQVYFFGEVKGTVAKDDSHVKAEGTTFLGAGIKW